MKFNRVWEMPNGDTLSVGAIHDLVTRWIKDRQCIVDPFARDCALGTITNDLNPQTKAQHHMRANEFASMLVKDGIRADAIIFDPPYSIRQAKELYEW